jgi:hypothetical protein
MKINSCTQSINQSMCQYPPNSQDLREQDHPSGEDPVLRLRHGLHVGGQVQPAELDC